MKLVVILIIVGIVGSLGSALVYLFRDDNDSRRTVRALTWRVSLSVALFVLLLVGYWLGLIQPRIA